jgi:hypothetical protein
MDIEVFKQELQNLRLSNLYVVQNGQYIDAIKSVAEKAFIDHEKSEIIAYLDKEPSIEGKDGILVMSDGLVWSFKGSTIDGKESQFGANYNFEFFKAFDVSLAKNSNSITLIRQDITQKGEFEIFFPFKKTDKEKREEYAQSLERFFNIFCGSEEGEVHDEKNGALIREYIGDSYTAFYTKAFNKYCVNGIDKFAFNFSWGGLIFGIVNMVHRKLYIEGLIAFLVCGIISYMQLWYANILFSLMFAIINPFLVYKRYKKILIQCASKNMSFKQKKQTLGTLGGTNIVTTILGSVISLIAIIIMIIYIFKS